jgi:hypothetical protein
LALAPGHFFCTKGDVRRMVEISPSDPAMWRTLDGERLPLIL